MSLNMGKSKEKSSSIENYNKSAQQQQQETLAQAGQTTGVTNTTGTQTGTSMGTTTGSTTGTTVGQNTSTVNPWAAAQPYLENYLGMLGGSMGQIGQTTAGQDSALTALRSGFAGGTQNPYQAQTDELVNNLMSTTSRAGDVGTAYADYARRLEGTANGNNINLESNPYIQQMLQKTTDDAVTRTNDMFAGAGRSFSGANQRAIGQAVGEAQTPILAQLYQYEQGRTDAAGRDLFGGAVTSANTQTSLDGAANQARASGLNVASAGFGLGDQAYESGMRGATDAYNLETQLRNMGINDLTQYGGLLSGVAGLGQTATGTSAQTSGQQQTQQTQQMTQQQTQQQQEQQLQELISKILNASGTSKEKGSGTSSGTSSSSNFGLGLKII